MEEQKSWTIIEENNSKDCKYQVPVPADLTNGMYNNFDEITCGHPIGSGQRCCIKNKHLCPIRAIPAEYRTKTISCEP